MRPDFSGFSLSDTSDSSDEPVIDTLDASTTEDTPTGDPAEDPDKGDKPDAADTTDAELKKDAPDEAPEAKAKATEDESGDKQTKKEDGQKADDPKDKVDTSSTKDLPDEHELGDDKTPAKDLRAKFSERLDEYKDHRDGIRRLGGTAIAKRLEPVASVIRNADAKTKDTREALQSALGDERFADFVNDSFWELADTPEVVTKLISDKKIQAAVISDKKIQAAVLKALTGREVNTKTVKDAVAAFAGVFGEGQDDPEEPEPDDVDSKSKSIKDDDKEAAKKDDKPAKREEPPAAQPDPEILKGEQTEVLDEFFNDLVKIADSVIKKMDWQETDKDTPAEKRAKAKAVKNVQNNLEAEVLKDKDAKKLFEEAMKHAKKGKAGKRDALDLLPELRDSVKAAAARLCEEEDQDTVSPHRQVRKTTTQKSVTRRPESTSSASSPATAKRSDTTSPKLGSDEQRSTLANSFRDAMREGSRGAKPSAS